MKRSIVAMVCSLFILSMTCSAYASIHLKDMGSFHVGGREVTISGKEVKEILYVKGGVPAKVDPNGVYQVEQMYVQYFIPQKQKAELPLLMWHGGGLTGVTYESTPDGREGWRNYFIKKGWSVYVSDAVERGRSGWAMTPDVFKGDPVFVTKKYPFEAFRIGKGKGSYNEDPAQRVYLPGSQFPAAGYDNFVKQIVPRWVTTDDAIVAAYIELIDKVGPCVVMAHSQGGAFAFKVAQARPDKVKAIIAVEPAAGGDITKVAVLKNTPVLFVYGDFIAQDARWPTIKEKTMKFADALKAAGGNVEIINLPEIGIKGNTHMLMMDLNNMEIADVIQKWAQKQNLVK